MSERATDVDDPNGVTGADHPDGIGPVESRITASDGLPLSTQDHGGPANADVVLLVHGYPDDHHVWDLVVPLLTDTFRVVTFDVRGAGDSAAPEHRRDHRLPQLIADIALVADHVSPDRPVHLVGHDWGSIQGWSAVLDATVAERIASFTSMSGPSLEHVARWTTARRRPGGGRWAEALGQALKSWYIQAFHLPFAGAVWDLGLTRSWPDVLRRGDRDVRIDEHWPGPDLGRNGRNGIELYRANMLPMLGRGHDVRTDVPVQLVVARRDPFVAPSLLDGIEELAPNLVRVDADAGHWLPRSAPGAVADLVREHAVRNPID